LGISKNLQLHFHQIRRSSECDHADTFFFFRTSNAEKRCSALHRIIFLTVLEIAMRSLITIIALSSTGIRFSSSFALSPSNANDQRGLLKRTKLFQSSIALEGEKYIRNQNDARISCAYSPTIEAATKVSKINTQKSHQNVQINKHLTALQSKSLKELKLECSRRSIRYGKFAEKEEYINAIRQDMEKVSTFSMTGLVQPGAVAKLTEEQLEEELSGMDTLVMVHVFADWCNACNLNIKQLEIASKKLAKDKVRVLKIDADECQSWATKYQVEGLPAILLMQRDRVLDRLEGTRTTLEILDFVEQYTA